MATTVIIGSHALNRADHDRLVKVATHVRLSFCRSFGPNLLSSVVEVDQHHHAGFGGDADQRVQRFRRGVGYGKSCLFLRLHNARR